ncbi:MAG: hypothetical protein IT165_12735 [Bryobacterales bacterium]|nr:hypothetical protein [Bryobacterales bacterium]
MAKSPAIINGPVEVMEPNSGKLLSLPVSDIYFEDSQIKAQGSLYTANQALFDAFLGHLVKAGAVTPGPQSPTKPVMVLKAKTAGSTGNTILAVFSNFDSGTNPKFDATVSETDTYTALTPGTVQASLGTAAGNGTRPGLVFVPGAAPASTAVPKAGVYALTITSPATAAKADIPLNTGSGTAFSVQAKADGADGELTTVEIKDVDATARTFTLVAAWKKTPAAKVLPTDLASTFSYEMDVTPPEGAAAVGTPAAGSVLLSGGADASAAVKATAIVAG